MSILRPVSPAGGLPFHFHSETDDVAPPRGSRLARCNTFTTSETHVRRAAPRGNCLISPGFNYLPSPPLGRRKGLRVNERRIDSGEDDEVCAGRLSRPRPLPFAPSQVKRSDRVCRIVRGHKMKRRLGIEPPPVQTAVVLLGNSKFFGKRAKMLLFQKWRSLRSNCRCVWVQGHVSN